MNPPVPAPTGLPAVDRLARLQHPPTLDDYIEAVSEYVRKSSRLSAGQAKAAQIRLSAALGNTLAAELRAAAPDMQPVAGERDVSGALRIVKGDVSEFHPLDGLRLAVEIKPINLAVGRAIWNRFGDIRTFAVNLHLKFPFAVVGGVLAVPTYERSGRVKKDTTHLIERAVDRLSRAGGRENEGGAPHLLEGVGVVVYNPDTAKLDPEIPPEDLGLRWDEFVEIMATAYDSRFGG
jgi:hypothetical protein